PFTPTATWTGAAKVDMSKEGWKDRFQEKAMADFLEANGMDRSLATTVASTTNAKIKAKKAKKEEKTKAIESTAQTALAITALVLTAGAAAPAVAATTTATTAATTAASFTSTIASAISTGISTLGAVVTGTASVGNYVQVASIALQAAIGSRTGGVEGAMAGAANGVLQAFAGSLGSKEAGAIKDKADLIAKEVSAGRMTLKAGAEALEKAKLVSAGVKAIAATNVSYTKKDGWGVKANVSGLVQSLGVNMGATRTFMDRFANVTIGQSQRGGAIVNLGFNTGAGTLGLNYTGATGKFDGSFDVMERQAGTGKLSAELNYGEDGFSVSGNADLGNGLGFGIENGRNGTTGSLTIIGSQQGTVDEDGNYEANGNFLGEISGQDIIDLNEARQAERDAAENERNPVKSAKDAKNAKDAADAKEARDDDAKEVGGEEGPSGLVDLAFAGLGVVMSAGAAFLAGGGSGSASPSGSAGGQSSAGNGGNANTVVRRPEDELPIGHDNDDPNKGLTRNELSEYNTLQDKLRNGEDLSPEDAERHAQLAGIRNIQINGNSVAQAVNGTKVRDTEAEIRKLRDAGDYDLSKDQEFQQRLKEAYSHAPNQEGKVPELQKLYKKAFEEGESAARKFGYLDAQAYGYSQRPPILRGSPEPEYYFKRSLNIFIEETIKSEANWNSLNDAEKYAKLMGLAKGFTSNYQAWFNGTSFAGDIWDIAQDLMSARLALQKNPQPRPIPTNQTEIKIPGKGYPPTRTSLYAPDHPFNAHYDKLFPNGGKIPVINGRLPINSDYAGKVFKLPNDLQQKYKIEGIKFNEHGFPDFSNVAVPSKTVKIKNMKGDDSDFTKADKEAGYNAQNPRPKGYTWHHNEDLKTMQLIPRDVHEAVRHTGAASMIDFLRSQGLWKN
ncbi:MAG TPA: HNH endonuclease, partial [Leptospiraceae bacterium]|nr:HNH endonuclease [Leptospiraceae bacterium]